MSSLNVESKDYYNVLISYSNDKDPLPKWVNLTLDNIDICNIEGYFRKHQDSKVLNVIVHEITKKC